MNIKQYVAGTVVALSSMVALAATEVDAALPDYASASGVSGNLSSVGSDTLANLMTLWGEDFKRIYPNVNIQIQAAGSSTAPPALTEGTSNIGPMSRKMKDKEIEAFETKYGYKPTAIPVAIDALAVFVHKDNPIKGMTMAQVDAVFSSTHKCGHADNVETWGVDIILTGEIKYFNELYNILNEAMQLGFKHWLLIDIKWVSRIYNMATEEDFMGYEEIRNYNKVDNNSKIKKYPGTQIYPGLYKSIINKPNPWGEKILKEGKYKLGIAKMDTYIIYNENI